jgi:hypothetical protein
MRAPCANRDPDLDLVLRALVAGARDVLDARFTGAYLIGSLARFEAGADEHSDVDFVIAVGEDVPLPVLGALQAMHHRIHALGSKWARRLDGSYVPTRILRRADPERTPLPYLDHGRRDLVPSTHCNRLVIRKMVRDQSLTLAGPDPESLVAPVSPIELAREAATELAAWAAEIDADPAQLANRWSQPYVVLSFCRMLYTLASGELASKPVAAAWGRKELGARWDRLIAHAVAARGDPAARVRERADPRHIHLTRAFVRAAVELSRRSQWPKA